MERKVVFEALVGSHNYNLQTENSDKDYKIICLPTFSDLYKGNMYSKSIIREDKDQDVHDVRKLVNLFYKSNINFLEVLFSNEIFWEQGDKSLNEFMQKLLIVRYEIARINLPYLYNACVGMHKQKMSQLNKGTEGTQHLVDKYGYNTKQALHAYRVLDFLIRFEETDFYDFKSAMTYKEDERDYMLEIKNGFYREEVFRNMINNLMESRIVHLKEKYYAHEPNEELKEHLESTIMELVKENI